VRMSGVTFPAPGQGHGGEGRRTILSGHAEVDAAAGNVWPILVQHKDVMLR
jgi:hypothetical protein